MVWQGEVCSEFGGERRGGQGVVWCEAECEGEGEAEGRWRWR